jgi:hypothetical protein
MHTLATSRGESAAHAMFAMPGKGVCVPHLFAHVLSWPCEAPRRIWPLFSVFMLFNASR